VRLTEERVMLVLSRKLGQSFRLGPDVRVTIVKIDRNSVRIGIEAPGEVPIQREEIVFELPAAYALESEAA
jgi:carbon storage regulator